MTRDSALNILKLKDPITEDQLKRAYRTLAMKTHPDKEGGDKLQFMNVKSAYDFLSVNIDPDAAARRQAQKLRDWLIQERARIEYAEKQRIAAGKLLIKSFLCWLAFSYLFSMLMHYLLDNLTESKGINIILNLVASFVSVGASVLILTRLSKVVNFIRRFKK